MSAVPTVDMPLPGPADGMPLLDAGRRAEMRPGPVAVPVIITVIALATVGVLDRRPVADVAASRVLTSILVVAVIAAAVRAPRPVLVAAAFVGAVAAPVAVVPAAVAAGVLAVLDTAASWHRPARAAIGAALAVVWLRSSVGSTALDVLAATAALGSVIGAGWWSLPRPWRARLGLAAGVVLLAVAGATGVLGWRLAHEVGSAVAVRGQLTTAVQALRAGDVDTARHALEAVQAELGRVERVFDGPFDELTGLVPVVSQHVAVAQRAVRDAAATSDAGRAVVAALDDPALVRDGRIDAAGAALLAERLGRLETASAALTEDLRARSPWIVPALSRRLTALGSAIEPARSLAARGRLAADLLTSMLGADEPRRYLVAFLTPSEARAAGGLMGNLAELRVDDGHVNLERFQRTSDIAQAVRSAATPLRAAGSASFRTRYGRFGADDGRGHATADIWSNLTMTPEHPEMAAVLADLYEQYAGVAVDGVLTIDPAGIAALLDGVGAVASPTLGDALDAGNAVAFLQREQYVRFADDKGARLQVLAEVARGAFTRLLSIGTREAWSAARALGPAVAGDHVTLWSARPGEQQAIATLGLAGSLGPVDGDDLLVVSQNASGNKIDAYVHRAVTYAVATDEATGDTSATVTVTLTNDAPADGLPDYVIGNLVNDPRGSSRQYVSVYSPLGAVGGDIDGTAVALESERELGRFVTSTHVLVPAGATVTLTVDLAGNLPPGPYRLTVHPQPTALVDALVVTLERATAGDTPPVELYRGDVRAAISLPS